MALGKTNDSWCEYGERTKKQSVVELLLFPIINDWLVHFQTRR